MGEKHHCRGCGHEIELQTTRCPECGAILETVVTESGGEPFEEFVASLVRTHDDIRHAMDSIGAALKTRDATSALAASMTLKDILDRHVVDEEARILKVLIDAYGRDGAAEAIRTMQQHRSIHKLVNEILDAAKPSTEGASKKLAELEKTLREHFQAEEGRIFPWALEAHGKLGRDPHVRNG